MPCHPAKARLLLKQGKAKVIKREPFTIQLNHQSTHYIQPVSLGIDAGTAHIGLSATTKKKAWFEAEVLPRTDIADLLSTRREMRRSRRNHKTRYRQSRFLNRKKPEGWIAPSIQNKVDFHLKVINFVHTLLPIKQLTIEVAQFDTQKLIHPDIQGIEYQQGERTNLYGWNNREYVLFRDHHTCQLCHGKSGDKILNIHHIESRKTGGNSFNNLITLCETCHHKIHKEHLEGLFTRKHQSLRDASAMTIMRWFIYNKVKAVYPDAKLTYGYITKHTRIKHGLPKSHIVDARCISRNPLAKPSAKNTYLMKQVRENNRQLHKMTIGKGGKRKLNKQVRYIHGFQLFDKVSYKGKIGFVWGRRKTGYFLIKTLTGEKIHASARAKDLILIERASTLLKQII